MYKLVKDWGSIQLDVYEAMRNNGMGNSDDLNNATNWIMNIIKCSFIKEGGE